MRAPCLFAALAATVMMAGSPASPVAGDGDHERARRLRDAGEIVSLETVLQALRRDHAGRVLEVDLEYEKDTLVYEIELLDDGGRVRKFYYDARTGEPVAGRNAGARSEEGAD